MWLKKSSFLILTDATQKDTSYHVIFCEYSTIEGHHLIVIGKGNIVKGYDIIVIGFDCVGIGDRIHIMGISNVSMNSSMEEMNEIFIKKIKQRKKTDMFIMRNVRSEKETHTKLSYQTGLMGMIADDSYDGPCGIFARSDRVPRIFDFSRQDILSMEDGTRGFEIMFS